MADNMEAAPPLRRRRHRVLTQILTEADAVGKMNWAVSVDATTRS